MCDQGRCGMGKGAPGHGGRTCYGYRQSRRRWILRRQHGQQTRCLIKKRVWRIQGQDPVLQHWFNIPRVFFSYLGWLKLTIAVTLSGHTTVDINSDKWPGKTTNLPKRSVSARCTPYFCCGALRHPQNKRMCWLHESGTVSNFLCTLLDSILIL